MADGPPGAATGRTGRSRVGGSRTSCAWDTGDVLQELSLPALLFPSRACPCLDLPGNKLLPKAGVKSEF